MTKDQFVAEIANLPVEDRLAIVQAVWEGLPEVSSPSDTAKIKAELDRRMANYHNDPSSALSFEEFKAMRDSRRQ